MADITITSTTIPNYRYSGTTHTLRVYCPEGFTASDNTIVPAGMPGSGQWYDEIDGTLTGTDTAYDDIPLKSTTDGVNSQSAKYIFVITVGGVEKEWLTIDGISEFKIPASPATSSFAALATYNRARVRNLNRDEFYTRDQVQALITEIAGAPQNAAYITKTANGNLTNEFALGSLSSGVLKVTTATGDLTSVAAPNGAIVGATDAQTLTNKDLSSGTNTFPAFATLTGSQTLTDKTLDNTTTVTLKDSLFTLQDNSDATKQAKFECSGISTGTSRTFTLPNESVTLGSPSPPFETLTDGATITWALGGRQTSNAIVTLGGSRTLAITGASDGASGLLIVKQDATGSRSLVLPVGSRVINGSSGIITLTTTANAYDVLAFVYVGSISTYFWSYGVNFT